MTSPLFTCATFSSPSCSFSLTLPMQKFATKSEYLAWYQHGKHGREAPDGAKTPNYRRTANDSALLRADKHHSRNVGWYMFGAHSLGQEHDNNGLTGDSGYFGSECCIPRGEGEF